MNVILSWAITVLVLLLLATFAWAVFSLRSLPTAQRPRTRTYDRFGRFLAVVENPDYHENPGEDTEPPGEISPGSAPSPGSRHLP
jgi:hypothetical protein